MPPPPQHQTDSALAAEEARVAWSLTFGIGLCACMPLIATMQGLRAMDAAAIQGFFLILGALIGLRAWSRWLTRGLRQHQRWAVIGYGVERLVFGSVILLGCTLLPSIWWLDIVARIMLGTIVLMHTLQRIGVVIRRLRG